MQITIDVDVSAAQAQLEAIRARIDAALPGAMKEANSLLLEQVRDYPPPPDPIQGPALVPVRTFQAKYTRIDGSVGYREVKVRSNRASGKGITMAKAQSLRYKRTNTLYRSWQTVLTGGGDELVGGVVSSGQIAPYNRYVQDEAMQARIHEGRWDTVQEIGRRSEGEIQEMFAARIAAAIG